MVDMLYQAMSEAIGKQDLERSTIAGDSPVREKTCVVLS